MAERNYLDERKCINCVNATFKEHFGEGNELFYCAKHRTMITTLTYALVVIGCHGADFISRTAEKKKQKTEQEKKPDGQMTIADWLSQKGD